MDAVDPRKKLKAQSRPGMSSGNVVCPKVLQSPPRLLAMTRIRTGIARRPDGPEDANPMNRRLPAEVCLVEGVEKVRITKEPPVSDDRKLRFF